MPSITIDRSKPRREEPGTGHNRWHPDIPPVIEVDDGVEVMLETRDAFDGQLHPSATECVFDTVDAGVIHPLTGPVAVKGAEPGDLPEKASDAVEAPNDVVTALLPEDLFVG